MSDAAANIGVESVMARCLLDADFLRAMSSDAASALASYDLDAAAWRDLVELDFTGVRHFAGFITKVQHNYLWYWVPYTRALVKRHRIEIEVFSAYHGRHLELRARQATRAERIASFLDHLGGYVADGRWPGLTEILRHERIQWEIEMSGPAAAAPEPQAGAGRFADRVPTVRGSLRVGAFELSPLEIVAQLAGGEFCAERLVARPHCLVYWADPVGECLRILEADELTGALLAHVDGRRSVHAVVGSAIGETASEETLERVRPVFDAAVHGGLLALCSGGEPMGEVR